jgi:short-subunit dehydrogenase
MTFLFFLRKIKKWKSRKEMNFNGKVFFLFRLLINYLKVIWLTGASSGIGEALTYKFSELGAKLIISSRRLNELERVKNNCKYPENVEIFILDMSNADQLEILVNDYFAKNPGKKIDILLNNAGLSMRATCLEHTFEKDKYIMNVNFLSVIALSKVFLFVMS